MSKGNDINHHIYFCLVDLIHGISYILAEETNQYEKSSNNTRSMERRKYVYSLLPRTQKWKNKSNSITRQVNL